MLNENLNLPDIEFVGLKNSIHNGEIEKFGV